MTINLTCKCSSSLCVFSRSLKEALAHSNHVGQTERARELHNLTPKAESTPDYNAFRFAHQMAALICVQHTSVQAGATAGSTLNGTATSATPQAIVRTNDCCAASRI